MYSILMSLHLRILIFFVNHFKLLIPQRWFECLYVFIGWFGLSWGTCDPSLELLGLVIKLFEFGRQFRLVAMTTLPTVTREEWHRSRWQHALHQRPLISFLHADTLRPNLPCVCVCVFDCVCFQQLILVWVHSWTVPWVGGTLLLALHIGWLQRS